jgi:hypothetical protein
MRVILSQFDIEGSVIHKAHFNLFLVIPVAFHTVTYRVFARGEESEITTIIRLACARLYDLCVSIQNDD